MIHEQVSFPVRTECLYRFRIRKNKSGRLSGAFPDKAGMESQASGHRGIRVVFHTERDMKRAACDTVFHRKEKIERILPEGAAVGLQGEDYRGIIGLPGVERFEPDKAVLVHGILIPRPDGQPAPAW